MHLAGTIIFHVLSVFCFVFCCEALACPSHAKIPFLQYGQLSYDQVPCAILMTG